MSSSLVESYAWCRSLSRRRGRNFYYSFLPLAREKFRDMCVLYAYMRVCDDLGDNQQVPADERARRLEEWRSQLDAALGGGPAGHPALPALVEVVARYQIPREHLFEVIDGVASDLRPRRFDTFDELLHYCFQVAGAVGLCCIRVWGFRGAQADSLAVDCGTAFQLTNILRDLGEDAGAGRVYLPQEDLARFEYTAEDLAARRRDERFTRLMQFEVDRTRGFYRRAEDLLDCLDRRGRAIYASMLGIYSGLLDEIERRDFDVFTRRVSVPRWRKVRIALGSLFRHRVLGRLRGESPFETGRQTAEARHD